MINDGIQPDKYTNSIIINGIKICKAPIDYT